MAITANQSLAEWLSDILAALGYAGGAVSAGAGGTVQGVVADGAAAGTTKPVLIGTVDSAGNAQSLVSRDGGTYNSGVAAASVVDFLGVIPLSRAPSSGSFFPFSTATGDGLSTAYPVQISEMLFNGSTVDRTRAANAAAGTTGTGLLGAGVLFYDGTNWQQYRPATGTHANAWNNAATGAGGTSAALDCQIGAQVSFFGNTSGATTFTVQFSQDNLNWYDTGTTLSPGGAGNFGTTFTAGARYVRVKSSNNVTVTGTLAAKQ